MNRTRIRRRALRDLWRVDSYLDYHGLLFAGALEPYLARAKARGHEPGRILAVGASAREARFLLGFPFEEIVLSGVTEPDAALERALLRDSRLRYELANAERLPYPSASFDLVLCKESLHHLARPVQGLYEMLRVCRRAAVMIEPWDDGLPRLLERLGVARLYERGQVHNVRGRDNHVYRWSRRGLETLLRSLYLDSGFDLDLQVGWLSVRALVRAPRPLRRLAALGGFAASYLPGMRGNLVTALIEPGRDLPPDPHPPAEACSGGRSPLQPGSPFCR